MSGHCAGVTMHPLLPRDIASESYLDDSKTKRCLSVDDAMSTLKGGVTICMASTGTVDCSRFDKYSTLDGYITSYHTKAKAKRKKYVQIVHKISSKKIKNEQILSCKCIYSFIHNGLNDDPIIRFKCILHELLILHYSYSYFSINCSTLHITMFASTRQFVRNRRWRRMIFSTRWPITQKYAIALSMPISGQKIGTHCKHQFVIFIAAKRFYWRAAPDSWDKFG